MKGQEGGDELRWRKNTQGRVGWERCYFCKIGESL
jgi:hypothetical protein